MNSIKGNLVDVVQKKIYPARIFFDTRIRKIEPLTGRIDNRYILPGLVDAHVHIESSMLPPSEFARMAVRHGTLASVVDPHEIANVAGTEGIEFMMADAARVPFRFVFGAPSCVPATPLETTGSKITAHDIDTLFNDKKVSHLSEIMNYPGVVNRDPEVMTKLAIARKYGKPVDVHAPGLSGEALIRYVEAGISTDHECSDLAEAEEKIRLGMTIQIRQGSAAQNFEALYPLIEKYPDKVMLCTDDFHPDDLLNKHINQLLSKGVAKGVELFSLICAATLNPIKHYQIDLGLVQSGDAADFVVFENLTDFKVLQSFLRGICIYDRVGEFQFAYQSVSPIDHAHLNRFGASRIAPENLQVVATSEKMKVIQIFDGSLFTKQIVVDVKKGVSVPTDTDADILKLVVVDRYQPSKPAVAFVRGFNLVRGALVSSVAHDSHHIIAVGCDDTCLVQAINHIIDIKGGLAVCYQQGIIDLTLDIGGLMSSAPGEKTAYAYEEINWAAISLGCTLKAPFMTLSFLALLVIPELKIGAQGLFDVNRFEWTDSFITKFITK